MACECGGDLDTGYEHSNNCAGFWPPDYIKAARAKDLREGKPLEEGVRPVERVQPKEWGYAVSVTDCDVYFAEVLLIRPGRRVFLDTAAHATFFALKGAFRVTTNALTGTYESLTLCPGDCWDALDGRHVVEAIGGTGRLLLFGAPKK